MHVCITVFFQRVAPIPENGVASQGAQSSNSTYKTRARRNIIRTLAIVSIAFFLCFVWNQVTVCLSVEMSVCSLSAARLSTCITFSLSLHMSDSSIIWIISFSALLSTTLSILITILFKSILASILFQSILASILSQSIIASTLFLFVLDYIFYHYS